MKTLILTLLLSTNAMAANGWECTLHSAGAFEATNDAQITSSTTFGLIYYDYTRHAYTKDAALADLKNVCVSAFVESTPYNTVRLKGQPPLKAIGDYQKNVENNLAVCCEAVPRLSTCEQIDLGDK